MFELLRDQKFRQATALLVSTMVGVGIFGIPFAFAKAGVWIGSIWLIALAGLTGLYNLMFAEVPLRTQGTHQIAGYASIWLGPWARRVTCLANALSGYGALLAYMIIVGEFLHNVLSRYIAINPDWYSLIFAVGWSLLVLVRLRTVAVVDQVMMILFGLTVAIILGFGIPHINLGNFRQITWEYWFLPYGIIMFALSGANSIPLQRQLLTGREKLLRPAIITAVALVALLYLVFAFTVAGVSGEVTTPDAIGGLYDILGPGIVVLGSLFGIMTISTSFLMMAEGLHEMFHIDYKVPTISAWLMVIVPPLLFFGSGLRNFIDVIGLVGSVAVGLLSIIVLGTWLKSRRFVLRQPEWNLRLPAVTAWGLMIVFMAGIIYALAIQ